MPRSTVVIAFILLAFVAAGAGLTPALAQSGGKIISSRVSTSDDEYQICLYEIIEIPAQVVRAVEFPSGKAARVQRPGIDITARSGDPNVVSLLGESDLAPLTGGTMFKFRGDKVGLAHLYFNAVVTLVRGEVAIGSTSSEPNKAEAMVSVTVVDCSYEVTTIGQWSVPGPANIFVAATSGNADVKAPDAQSPFSGSTTVTWVVTTDRVEDCFAQLVTTSTQLDWNGLMDEDGQLTLDGTYQAAAMSLPTYCVGSDGGIVDRSTPIQLALDPLQTSSPSSGSVSSQFQVLHGPEDMPGQVTIVVVPKDEETAMLGIKPQTAYAPWLFVALVGLILAPAVTSRSKNSLKPSSKGWLVLLILVPLVTLSACGSGPSATPLEPEQDVVFGPGDFIFPDTNSGLEELSSYKATLTLTFDGTRGGQAEHRTETYVMLSTKEPAVRHLTIVAAGDVSESEPVFVAEMDGAAYEQRGESACTATVIDPENSLLDSLAPAGLLPPVIGAEEAGSEAANEAASNHYTFDERAFGQQGIAQSTGEMWVAAEGDYIVRYFATIEGDTLYFGEGVEGTITWDYELTDINALAAIELPADCPAGMVDAPLLADATNILDMPSVLAYNTSSAPADTAAFYQEQIPSLGWGLQGEPNLTDDFATLHFIKSDETLRVIISAGDGITKVYIVLSHTSGQEGIIAPPVDTSTGETPLLPDATNVVTISGLVKYETLSTPEEAESFYKEELQRLGWTLESEIKTGGVFSFLFTKGTQSISILISAMGSGTTIAITTG